ncbi:MAG: hypothetical protein GXP25_22850 [Planctomycetes bacterium]|nr:hypothetical protein [Planctomycetota bacterium]
MTTFGGRSAVAFRFMLIVGLATGWLLSPVSAPAQDREQKLAWHQVFQKAGTWPETMLLSRTRYRKWRAADPGTRVKPFDAANLALKRIRVADPTFRIYERRVARDWAQLRLPPPRTGEVRSATPLDWFNSTDTTIERGLIRLVLDRMESDCSIARLATAPFRARLAALERDDVSPEDTRWLELYCTVTDWEKDLERISGLDTFRDSAELIAREFPDECAYTSDALFGKLEQLNGRWEKLREPLLQYPEQARPEVVKLVGEYAAVRDRVQFGLRSVQEFLAKCQGLDMKTEWQEQLTNLYAELQRREWYQKPAIQRQALRRAALILDSDRDPTDVVLRRTRALLDELKRRADPISRSEALPRSGGTRAVSVPRQSLGTRNTRQSLGTRKSLDAYETRLRRLEETAGMIAPRLVDARRALFFEVCRLRRRIAFSNPLLDFDRVLFVKRHFLRWGTGPAQKQYHGDRAHGGGALCVLEHPFGSAPKVTDLLADSTCERGRMKGRRLKGGDFVSPELSYDGETVLFSYTENSRATAPAQFVDVRRTLKNTYHIFKVRADGTDLEQLTDGPFNDVDPCFLPDGRIAFISERRGGCGRSAADRTYTLHSMAADGSDMVRLSHHETNEWQPSVDHNGMILYTRWDIWDRGYFQAMNIWITHPNGSDGRALFGNYYDGADPCQNATMDVRAIPGSRKLIGTASSYFEQSYGALILVDPLIPDDPSMTKLKRITPGQPFTWRESPRYMGPLDYGTPWPLSELFYVCVYDSDSAVEKGPKNNYGIYLVDAFGNKELLYRDPRISCLSPMPLRPRPRPPIVLRYASGRVKAGEKTPTRGPDAVPMATVGLMNVYRSYYPFPKDVRITQLRIIQVAYKSVVGRNIPVTGYGEDTGHDKGGRMVLGTVPVEKDGSAYFRMPAGVPVNFQAIAEDGLAMQTMRSVTYAQPGERLFCLGCHEPQEAAPALAKAFPEAFRRDPSAIQRDVEGSYPVSFPRLIQPLLDKRCVTCHKKHPDKAPNLERGTRWKDYGTQLYDNAKTRVIQSIPPSRWAKEGYKYIWYDSYINLYPYVRAGCFVKHGSQEGAETKPGTFGARVTKLYQMLKKGHNDLHLSEEEMHRIALWIDTNCRFFGPTRHLMEQAMGKKVMPEIE